MMELIGKRVGKELELVATGNVFFLTQVITAILLAIIGALINDDSKTNSTISLIIIASLLLINFLYGVGASCLSNRPFDKSIPSGEKVIKG